MILHSFFVPLLSERMRIFDYVYLHLSRVFPSKNAVKKAFKNQLILLNGKIALSSEWLSEGDRVEVKVQDLGSFKTFPLKLEVLFEDAFIAVINKPAGFSVSGNFHKTIQNALNYNLKISTFDDALTIPRPVHRLDKLTSGILLVAKTRKAQRYLGSQFENQLVSKTYYAIVKGKLEGSGQFDSDIEGLPAFTTYKSIRVEKSLTYNSVSLIELKPKTGRTHQLRIHLARAGHPIIGDYMHDNKNILKGKGLFLSACNITFNHPETKESLFFALKMPNKYDLLFERELRRWKKFNA